MVVQGGRAGAVPRRGVDGVSRRRGRTKPAPSVAKTRLQAEPAGGAKTPRLWSTLGNIVQQEGWARLYSGVGASLLLTVNPAIQHTCFEQARRRVIGGLRRRAARRNGGVVSGAKKIAELSVSDAFVLGAASKAIATFITYPLVRAKVLAKAPERKDAGKRRDARKGAERVAAERFRGKSLPAVMRGVVETEGPAGLYKGLQAQLLKTVLVAAFSLTVKEKSFRTAMLVVLLMNRL
mgnify:CR=1 FL=1